MKIAGALTVLVVLLTACASSPDLEYYTIDMGESGGAQTGVHLRVEHFSVSEKLDRSQIVIQVSPTRIEYYSHARWAAGVGEMVRQKLAAEFGSPVEGRRAFAVRGRVVAFEQVDGRQGPRVRVRLEIQLHEAGPEGSDDPLIDASYETERPAEEDGVDAVVQALSRALEDIAADIAEDVRGLAVIGE
jgi:uncharacterized lipoprotein YmbA